VIDFRRGLSDDQKGKLKVARIVEAKRIADATKAFQYYGKSDANGDHCDRIDVDYGAQDCLVYTHSDFPGLCLYPALLPLETQRLLISRIMHRALANPDHTTNINLDYQVQYPSRSTPNSSAEASFFSFRQVSPDQILVPKCSKASEGSSAKLKPLNMSQYLQKKLRWLTLGDQYQWSTCSYSGADTTLFPPDIAALVTPLFPALKPESGVVLLYSKTDFMPVHRDVSEVCERGLASISLGCDGLFILATDTVDREDRLENVVVIRVRSGDVVQMDGEARWFWHAMPKVIPGTCPEVLRDWPAGSERDTGEKEGKYDQWKGYMSSKRINLSCRQVWN